MWVVRPRFMFFLIKMIRQMMILGRHSFPFSLCRMIQLELEAFVRLNWPCYDMAFGIFCSVGNLEIIVAAACTCVCVYVCMSVCVRERNGGEFLRANWIWWCWIYKIKAYIQHNSNSKVTVCINGYFQCKCTDCINQLGLICNPLAGQGIEKKGEKTVSIMTRQWN